MGLVISNYYGGTAKAIARALGWRVSLTDPARHRRRDVINYGTTQGIKSHPLRVIKLLNKPSAVQRAVDKAETLRVLEAAAIPCLTFTTEYGIAREWLADGRSVVCRKILNGHSGQGIDILKWEDWKRAGKPEAQFPANVKLFTKYFPKKEEVRVHVFRGKIIGYAAKRKRAGAEADPWVRSHSRGWIFATQGVEQSDVANAAALGAVAALGLDYGAVDIGIGKDGVAVFEVNSAPGMEGRTLDAYVDNFKQYFAE